MARILAIDNEPTILSLLATILKKDGHEVTAVESADRALELKMCIRDRYYPVQRFDAADF